MFVCHLFRIVPLLYVTWLRINDIYISSTEHIVLHVLTLLNITLNISMTSDVLEHFKCGSVKRCCSKCVKRCTFNLLPLLEWTSMAPYRVEVSRVPYGRQVSDCSTDGPRRGRPWTGPRQPGDEPLRDLEQASPWWSRCAVSQWLDNRCYVLSTETLSEKIGMWYLTYSRLVTYTHTYSVLGQHWFRKWLGACSAPSHFLGQCRHTINWVLWNTLQENLNNNTKITFNKIYSRCL